MQNFIWFFKILRRQWSWHNDSITLLFHGVFAIIIGVIVAHFTYGFVYVAFVYFCGFTIFHQVVKFSLFSLYIIFLLLNKKDHQARQSIIEMYNWRQADKNKRGIYISPDGVISHGTY